MTFTKGGTYQHRRNEDVATHVAKVQYRGLGYVKLRVRWWNINYQCFCTEVIDTVCVKVKDFSNWKRVLL